MQNLPDRTVKASRSETEALTNILEKEIAFNISFQGHLFPRI